MASIPLFHRRAPTPGVRRIQLKSLALAVALAAVVCAVVVGLFLVEVMSAQPIVQAAHVAPVKRSGNSIRAAPPTEARAMTDADNAWAADESARGTRPDASH
jgi:hypothetical protein